MRRRHLVALAALAVLAYLDRPALGASTGRIGYSGQGGFACEECHFSEGLPPPDVRFLVPAQVEPGAQVTVQFVVQPNDEEMDHAGFNVAASDGDLLLGDDPGIRRDRTGAFARFELTHTEPRVVSDGEAVFTFIWVAPATPGEYVLFGAGNAVNLDLSEVTGDESAITVVTVTVAAGACPGDCDGDGAVAINELITGVTIALGSAAVDGCPSLDANGDGGVAINELIAAVSRALNGCSDMG